MRNRFFYALGFLLFWGFLMCACQQKSFKIKRAFYYWKSQFEWNDWERELTENNGIGTLYVKYFDVVWNTAKNAAVPVAKINFKDAVPADMEVIPVVYISNKALQNTALEQVQTLTHDISGLIKSYNTIAKKKCFEVQIDCDWTLGTKEKYFVLLRTLKKDFESNIVISATIRLHQIKYAQSTGVPPVDKGMLMYYNMGDIQNKEVNSIFNVKDAEKYAAYLRQYTLPLDAVLPVFSWVKVYRNNQLVKLINNTSLTGVKQGINFIEMHQNAVKATGSAVVNGFYVLPDDVFVEEKMDVDLLKKSSQHLHQYFSPANFTLALFHLHKDNLNEFTTQDFEDLYTGFN